MPAESRNIYRAGATHTRVLASFHTDEANGVSIETPTMSDPTLGEIVGFTSSKALGAPSGSWTLTFKKPPSMGPRSALRDLWSEPEDVWVKIKVMVDGQLIDTVLGLIDSVREAGGRSGMGQRSEVYTISGRDFGKVLETTELWVNLFHNATDVLRSVGALTSSMMDQIIGTPEHFVRVLLEEWVGNSGTAEAQWMLPQGLGGGAFYAKLLNEGGRVRGIDAMSREVNGEAVAPALFQVDQTGGKLWEVMQEYANGMMNELFVDLGPAPGAGPKDLADLVPNVYLRERPFPTRADNNRTTTRTKWNQLRTHTLPRSDQMRRDITKGGASGRFNYFLLQLAGIGTEGFNVAEILQRGVDGVEYGRPGNIPIFNTESIAKHGLRRFMPTTRFVPFVTANQDTPQADLDNFFRLCAVWNKKLHDWYAPAPLQLSGQLVLPRIMPEIRVGNRAVEQRPEGAITYYVEQVDHAYTFPGSGSTTITVTHGEYDDDDTLGAIYGQYDNPRSLSEREACMIPEDATLDETLDALASGCRLNTPAGDVVGFTSRSEDLGSVEGDDFTVNPSPGQRTLEVERDGTTSGDPAPDAAAVGDPGMSRSLDDSEPTVGTPDAVPSPGADPSADDSVLDQGTLERGEPIPVADSYVDPIEGLEDAGP